MKGHLIAIVLAAVPLCVGCGGSSASTSQPKNPSEMAASDDSEATGPVPYSRYSDAMYLTLEGESNVYAKRSIARHWVVVAQLDAPGESREVRIAEAERAQEQMEIAVKGVSDVCAARVDIAVEKGERAKQALERAYLRVVEEQGDATVEARGLDSQVHFWRDEVHLLQLLAEPCPARMYGDQSGGVR